MQQVSVLKFASMPPWAVSPMRFFLLHAADRGFSLFLLLHASTPATHLFLLRSSGPPLGFFLLHAVDPG